MRFFPTAQLGPRGELVGCTIGDNLKLGLFLEDHVDAHDSGEDELAAGVVGWHVVVDL